MMIVEIENYTALKSALRRVVAELFAETDPDGAVFDSKLVINELVTNALRYGGGSAVLTAEREGEELRVSVRGKNNFRPPEKSACSDASSERGRGLFLVDALCVSRDYTEQDGVRVVIHIG